MRFTDSHLHITHCADPSAAVRAAAAAQLRLVSQGITLDDSAVQADLAQRLHFSFCAGVHPLFIQGDPDIDALAGVVTSPWCVGIGEIGLDSQARADLKLQLSWLKAQLDLAEALHLPVMLHVRGLHQELIACLRTYQGRLSGCVHGLAFSYELGRQYLNLGFKLGAGHLWFKSPKLRAAVSRLGLEAVMLESDFDNPDAEYPAAWIENLGSNIASCLNTSLDKVSALTERNAAIFA